MPNVSILNGYLLKDAAARENIAQLQTSVTEQLADIREEVRADITAISAAVGSPLVATTVAGMTDHEKIYVYTGSEQGYTAGNWYYWNGTAWTSGGVYNSQALNTDTTLTVPGAAADAAVVGKDFARLDYLVDLGDKVVNFDTTKNDTAGSAAAESNAVGDTVTFGTVNNWRYLTYDVSDVPDIAKFTITTRTSTVTTYCNYIFADVDNKVLSMDNTTKPASLGYVTIENIAVPAGAKTLYVSYYSSKSSMEVYYTVDADIVGAFEDVAKEFIAEYQPQAGNNINWEKNGIAIANGNNATSASTEDTRIRTATYLNSAVRRVTCTDDYLIRAFVYDSENNFIGSWTGASAVPGTVSNCWFRQIDIPAMGPNRKVRLVMAAANLTSEIGTTDAESVTLLRYIEEDVTAEEVAKAERSTFNVLRAVNTEDGKYPLYAGGINTTTGNNNGSDWDDARCRTGFIPVTVDCMVDIGSNDYLIGIWSYSNNAASAGTHGSTNGTYIRCALPIIVKHESTDAYIRLAFWRIDGEDLTTDLTDPTSDYSIIRNAIKIYYATDKDLTQAGAAADAAAVGTALASYTSPAQLGYGLSNNPVYKVPSYIHLVDFIDERYSAGGVNYDNTQGLCTDGTNIYYARRTFDVEIDGVKTSGVSLLKKVNAATGAVVAEDNNPSVNYGHCEDMCFVPSYVPGFDNGNVDRLYLVGVNRSPDLPSGGYVYVVNANTLEYITAFATGDTRTFWTDLTGVGMFYGIAYDPERGQFVVKYNIRNDANYNEALIIAGPDGSFIRGIKFNRVGQGNGVDTNGDYIFYPRYVSAGAAGTFNVYVNIFDWNLNKVIACSCNQYDWEQEGMCNIGNTVFMTWNEAAAGRTGFKISKSDFIQKARFNAPSEYTGWTGGITNVTPFTL